MMGDDDESSYQGKPCAVCLKPSIGTTPKRHLAKRLQHQPSSLHLPRSYTPHKATVFREAAQVDHHFCPPATL